MYIQLPLVCPSSRLKHVSAQCGHEVQQTCRTGNDHVNPASSYAEIKPSLPSILDLTDELQQNRNSSYNAEWSDTRALQTTAADAAVSTSARQCCSVHLRRVRGDELVLSSVKLRLINLDNHFLLNPSSQGSRRRRQSTLCFSLHKTSYHTKPFRSAGERYDNDPLRKSPKYFSTQFEFS